MCCEAKLRAIQTFFIPAGTTPPKCLCINSQSLRSTTNFRRRPSGHGKSSKPLTGNNYPQRERDLAALIEALGLKDLTLARLVAGRARRALVPERPRA